MIEQHDAERLAGAINHLRPEWPTRSLLTFISKNLSGRAFRDVAIAMTWIACDPKTLTPARVIEAGPWWNATRVDNPTVSAITHRCPEHPAERAWDCQPCLAEAADAAEGLAKVRAAVANAPRPAIAAEPKPAAHDLTEARAAADQENPE